MFTLIVIYNREARYDDALRVIGELQRRYPRNRLLWLEAASTALRASRPADARRAIEEDGPGSRGIGGLAPSAKRRAGTTTTALRSSACGKRNPRRRASRRAERRGARVASRPRAQGAGQARRPRRRSHAGADGVPDRLEPVPHASRRNVRGRGAGLDEEPYRSAKRGSSAVNGLECRSCRNRQPDGSRYVRAIQATDHRARTRRRKMPACSQADGRWVFCAASSSRRRAGSRSPDPPRRRRGGHARHAPVGVRFRHAYRRLSVGAGRSAIGAGSPAGAVRLRVSDLRQLRVDSAVAVRAEPDHADRRR